MARTANPNSANSQFFICFDDARFLDGQYTVWGEVTEGMENVDALPKGEPPRDPGKIVSMKVAADAEAGDGAAAEGLRHLRGSAGLPAPRDGRQDRHHRIVVGAELRAARDADRGPARAGVDVVDGQERDSEPGAGACRVSPAR